MIDWLNIWVHSKPWFWRFRTCLRKVAFIFERSAYQGSSSLFKVKSSARILYSFAWIGMKSLCWVVLALAALYFIEGYARSNIDLFPFLSAEDKKFIIEQLRLYAQLLTAIFSIYFATIGIILSAGYTRLRRDIIEMLTKEQVGSVYSRVLVFAAMFSLAATVFTIFHFEPGVLIYVVCTILTLLSALTLFPLGQRLFNFFDLILLVRSEMLPKIIRYIEGASNIRHSVSISNHYSIIARQALDQLSYIDDRIKENNDNLKDNLPSLTIVYSVVLLHYIQCKHKIEQDSYWFPRKRTHKQWFFAGDTATSMALRMSSQQLLFEEKTDRQWLENEIIDRLAGHINVAFQVGDFDLALDLINRFSDRIPAYAERFQFDVGMQELKKFKEIIEKSFASLDIVEGAKISKSKIGIADSWAALGSNLCLETLRRMITFEKELKEFFEADEWNEKSLRRLPAFLQIELAIIVERIDFEQKIEGKRLSRPKYVQQLSVQKLLQHYAKVLSAVCDFYQNLIPEFVTTLIKSNMPESATQVVLASLHCHWKLPRRFEDLARLVGRYHEYGHYTDERYKLPEINTNEMMQCLASAREEAIFLLGSKAMVGHVFTSKHDDELPDHFGQIYFELADACISALEQNDASKLDKVLPMFMSLAFLASDSKFTDSSLDVNIEFRLHLISTVINDLASVLGFAILYGAYYDNEHLSASALAKFDGFVERAPDKQQYFQRMVFLSNPRIINSFLSPRDSIRFGWKRSFEQRAIHDGFGERRCIRPRVLHPSKVVRTFLSSISDASHLFFAVHIVPKLDPVDCEIDHHITSLARQLRDGREEVQDEDI